MKTLTQLEQRKDTLENKVNALTNKLNSYRFDTAPLITGRSGRSRSMNNRHRKEVQQSEETFNLSGVSPRVFRPGI